MVDTVHNTKACIRMTQAHNVCENTIYTEDIYSNICFCKSVFSQNMKHGGRDYSNPNKLSNILKIVYC